jgi:WD40 repeat protein
MEDAVEALTLSDDATVADGAVVLLTDLADDALILVLSWLPLVHDVARAAQASRRLKHAAQLVFAVRPFLPTLGVVHAGCEVDSVAATDDGHILTGTNWKNDAGFHQGAVNFYHGNQHVRIQGHQGPVMVVAVLPGGTRFIIGSSDGTAKLFTFGGELERTFQVVFEDEPYGAVYCVAALPDGVHFVVGHSNRDLTDPNVGQVRLYHVDGTLVYAFYGHDASVNAVAVTRDGQHIISGSDDELVKVWSVASTSLVSTCDAPHSGGVGAVAAMPDGQRFLSSGGNGVVRVWLLNGTLENTFGHHTSFVNALVALPDNQHALSGAGSIDHNIKLFNVNDGAVLRTFKHHTRPVKCLALLPDGLRFVSGSNDGTSCIIDAGLM